MQDNLDISTFTLEQLEALAYRLVKQLNNAQQNLQVVEQEIQKRSADENAKKSVDSIKTNKPEK